MRLPDQQTLVMCLNRARSSSGLSSFEVGIAFEEWRCLRRPRAGPREFLHYHTHSKESSPRGLAPEERRFAHESAIRQSADRASTGASPMGSSSMAARECRSPLHPGQARMGSYPRSSVLTGLNPHSYDLTTHRNGSPARVRGSCQAAARSGSAASWVEAMLMTSSARWR